MTHGPGFFHNPFCLFKYFMHLVVSSTNFLIYFYSNPTFRRTFIGFLKPGDDGPSFGSDANAGPGFRSKANSVAGELIAKSSLAKTVDPCPTTSLMAKHQLSRFLRVQKPKEGRRNNVSFFAKSVHIMLVLPQTAQPSIYFC